MSKKPVTKLPSKTDLLRALKLYDYHWNSSVCPDENAAHDAAIAAIDEFEKTNPAYRALVRARDAAYEKRQVKMQQFENLLKTVKTAVFTKGVTPATVKMVEGLAKLVKPRGEI